MITMVGVLNDHPYGPYGVVGALVPLYWTACVNSPYEYSTPALDLQL